MADKKRSGTSTRKTKASAKTQSRTRTTKKKQGSHNSFRGEVILLLLLAVCILMFISNFGIGGAVGEGVSRALFGIFGLLAYVFPVCLFAGAAFYVSNKQNHVAVIKLIAAALFVIFMCVFLELVITGDSGEGARAAYQYSSQHKSGGGFVGGLVAPWLCKAVGVIGAYVIDIILLIITMVLITERSFLGGVKKSSKKVYDTARVESERYRQHAERRREEREQRREEQEQKRMDKKVTGVAIDTRIQPPAMEISDNLREVTPVTQTAPFTKKAMEKLFTSEPNHEPAREPVPQAPEQELVPVSRHVVEPVARGTEQKAPEYAPQEMPFPAHGMAEVPGGSVQSRAASLQAEQPGQIPMEQMPAACDLPSTAAGASACDLPAGPAAYDLPAAAAGSSGSAAPKPAGSAAYDLPAASAVQKSAGSHGEPADRERLSKGNKNQGQRPAEDVSRMEQTMTAGLERSREDYVFPPVSLLKQGDGKQGDSQKHLQETALKLQQTLKSFGVCVTITDVSCGPAVTRYELQPEVGVKVSKIVNLADDIKLNLAAADIRIEAPIPGKAAVGIEVPNNEVVMVRFRDMVESAEFQNHSSSICFTAGKDIGGKVVVADIAKMPHMLIAGATGSGKSVCINTIIMSLLYKANPEDVKLILIDPKVVELSVYNGIPHLFIPVVTDPKKAAGALHWAVSEMDERYQKFAEYQVRDLKSYNKKVAEIADIEDESKPKKLPQIVIIVDELADLMMVAPGEVEDAICRLAQLARAAGIHLIIATQRPSVDVITGLIKANMPSRIAFSVSSGVDSRTILDMNGAEKLLGNGDMLFYPQGYPKPLRVQGPFVSGPEVEAVVDFLKKQNTAVYNDAIEEKMNSISSQGAGSDNGAGERDAYFVDAGRFVIEKEKGSIGMLQRWFKVGFNRAARIMDQLEEAGVVGPEEGTKPRKILMSLEQFEAYVEEYV